MMDSEKHRDIIKQMAKRLREHTLPYKEGAWERFETYEAKKSKRFVLWPYLSGAAAVVIMAVALLLNRDQRIPVQQVTTVSSSGHNDIVEKVPSPAFAIPQPKAIVPKQQEARTLRLEAQGSGDKPVNKIVVDRSIQEVDRAAGEEKASVAAKENDTQVVQIPQKDELKREKAEAISSTTAPVPESFTQTVDRAKGLAHERGNENIVPKKWNVGIEVASTMSNNQVNIGGGIALAYSISPKVSISSGISYVQLDAQRGPSAGGPSSAMQAIAPPSGVLINSGVMGLGRPSEQKTLQSINSHLTGLDIPINLNYHISSRMYVSAGVSLFNVLAENRMNEFKSEVADVAYAGGSKNVPEPKIRTLYTEEAALETPYEQNNFAGFLNFSVGYRIPFSKTVGFSLAPFFKLPVGTLTEQDMDLTNGGIKVIASF